MNELIIDNVWWWLNPPAAAAARRDAYTDSNGNDSYDAGETPLNAISVFAYNENGTRAMLKMTR
ncbi:MAG: hypothetical protein R3E89_02630 [Thiolinea sp.]